MWWRVLEQVRRGKRNQTTGQKQRKTQKNCPTWVIYLPLYCASPQWGDAHTLSLQAAVFVFLLSKQAVSLCALPLGGTMTLIINPGSVFTVFALLRNAGKGPGNSASSPQPLVD